MSTKLASVIVVVATVKLVSQGSRAFWYLDSGNLEVVLGLAGSVCAE